MMDPRRTDDCPDCSPIPTRRQFLAATAATVAGVPLLTHKAVAAPTKTSAPETAVKALFDTLTSEQKKKVCFAWDHQDPKRGLLRTFVANNWQITEPKILGGFYTKKQQAIIEDIFYGLINPEWKERFLKQLTDDNEGEPWGTHQSIAIFGEPGTDQFEFVLTGRHQTLRADGNSNGHVAFGGPIFYGHAADSFNEKANHEGNVFWPQALAANKVYQMLDEKQRKAALIAKSPREQAVGFRGAKIREAPGLPVTGMSRDQKEQLQKTLMMLVDMYRKDDQDEALACIKKQGGIDACVLSFFEDNDIGKDKVWDNWRLEGPSFVWYFRGSPHVHVWVNVADDASVKTNA